MIGTQMVSRLDPEWYTPVYLPSEIQGFDTPVNHIGVGDPDKVGLLELDFACVEGTTRVTHQYQQGPLYILQPMYLDPGRPDMAFISTIQLGDGLLQGDRYRMDLNCAAGSAVHITTQAATKIYRMEENFASQIVNINVGSGAFVEYLPDPVIPFRDSRFYQRANLTIDPTASVIYGEILLPGRVAYGEVHAYTLYYTDTEVCDPTRRLLFADRLKLEPARNNVHSPGMLGAYDVFATLYIITHQLASKDLQERLYACLEEQQTVLTAVSTLPGDCGVAVRLLGLTSIDVKKAFALAWNQVRVALFGVSAPDLRKG